MKTNSGITNTPKIVLLAGGVGGAKMAEGLMHSRYCDGLSIIGNVADDQEFHGLWVSPDIDTLTYTLADRIDRQKGWGLKDDSNRTMSALTDLGVDTWMYLGDLDFATHIYRTEQRRKGIRPSTIAAHIANKMGIEVPILLPTDDRVQTQIETSLGWLDFQSYFVKNQCQPEITSIKFDGISTAKPTPESLQAIKEADIILFAPSNPIVSIGPILSIPGIREALQLSSAYKLAVSPIINGLTIKGPADKMLQASGYQTSVLGVADCYQGVIDGLVIDHKDHAHQTALIQRGLDVLIVNTFMETREDKITLAERSINWANKIYVSADDDPTGYTAQQAGYL